MRAVAASQPPIRTLLLAAAIASLTLVACKKDEPASADHDQENATDEPSTQRSSKSAKKLAQRADDESPRAQASASTDDAPKETAPSAAKPGVGPRVSIPAGAIKKKGGKLGPAIDAFEADVTEVTVAAYKACVDDGTCKAPDKCVDGNWGVKGRDRHPINCVTAADAALYCAWAGARVPSADELQYASLTGDGRTYPWGEKVPDPYSEGPVCWTNAGTCSVDAHRASKNPFGLADTMGNVAEWTRTIEGRNLVVMGGSYDGTSMGAAWPDFVAGIRRAIDPMTKAPDVGFRCVK